MSSGCEGLVDYGLAEHLWEAAADGPRQPVLLEVPEAPRGVRRGPAPTAVLVDGHRGGVEEGRGLPAGPRQPVLLEVPGAPRGV